MLVLFNIFAPFIIQNTLHYSVVAFGHIALVMGCAYFLGTFTNRFLVNIIRPIHLATIGHVGVIIISVLMLLLALTIKINLYLILIPAFFIFVLLGWTFPNLFSEYAKLFPTAAAVFGTLL